MATKEFFTVNHLGQEERHTPQKVTYNGQSGNFWTRHVFAQNCWVYQGKAFHPDRATHKQIAG